MTREELERIEDIVHKTIYEFFEFCGDNEETPMTRQDDLLLEVNKAICNNIEKAWSNAGSRYIDHIRNMSDDQLAYFLNAIQPKVTLWSLSMMRALNRKPYKGVDALNGTNGDTRRFMSMLYKDYEYEMKLMDEERNQSLDDLHDYASGNDLKRALGHAELQTERQMESYTEER